jgi:hypothetical protein
MLTQVRGWLGATVVTAVTAVLVALDISDNAFREMWLRHALATDTVSGLLVLLLTVLVVDQVVRLRQIRDRSRAVGAQAAIMVEQARRSVAAVSAAIKETGARDAAGDELRTYLTMLMVGAPVLIDAAVTRAFLEQAQHLGGELAWALTQHEPGHASETSRLDESMRKLRAAAAPLLAPLTPAELTAAGDAATGGGSAGGHPAGNGSAPGADPAGQRPRP